MTNIKDYFSVSDFYIWLKLGIFRGGKVGRLGYLSDDSINECFLKKPLVYYEQPVKIKKYLGSGIYLLDIYQICKKISWKDYLLVIAINQSSKQQKKVLALKLRSELDEVEVLAVLSKASHAIQRERAKLAGNLKIQSSTQRRRRGYYG